MKAPASFLDYLAIARVDHVTKHIFIVPGVMLAYLLRGQRTDHLFSSIILGLATALCIASANYVINEWLDRDFDKFHPEKASRASVQRELKSAYVWSEWGLLILIGLTSAYLHSQLMLMVAVLFALQGVCYNIPPVRTKDMAYLDVISELINNPIRLVIGWVMVDPTSLPPSSVILAYWVGGAFLMAAKRMSEFRQLSASHGQELLAKYRSSFATYTEQSLLVSCFVYALLTIFFLGVFLIKYRIEYLLLIPIVIALFGSYLSISFRSNSSAQKPELLYREKRLIALVGLLTAAFVFATFVEMPSLTSLTEQLYIQVQ